MNQILTSNMTPIQALERLYPKSEAWAIYRMVMELCFGLSMTDIILGKDKKLSAENLKDLENIIQRLSSGEPVQYVIGKAEFCGHTFMVKPGVLIPRPETAEMTCAAGKHIHGKSVLDIGTGSGCIAITLAKAGGKVSALDVSAEALDVARKNAEALQCEVEFIQENILQAEFPGRHWDTIISNPPYICQSEAKEMHCNVLEHEPHLALFVPDEDPLIFYRAIAQFGRTHLNPGGKVFLEINRRFGQDIVQLMKEQGYSHIELHQDQFNNPRFIHCTY